MLRFSQRIDKLPIRKVIQRDEMDERLKARLFNFVQQILESEFVVFRDYDRYIDSIFLGLYCDFFGELRVTKSGFLRNFINELKDKVFVNDHIFFFYDFIEFLVSRVKGKKSIVINRFNKILEEEKSAYRFDINGLLVPIVDKIELEEIDKTTEEVSKYHTVYLHLRKAKKLFSDRDNPDYKNSIKESISAIEALVKIISNNENATLDIGLEKIRHLNPNLKEVLKKLYHFRGDQGGVAHAEKRGQKSEIKEAEARLVLVISHAIVNYLISNNINKL